MRADIMTHLHENKLCSVIRHHFPTIPQLMTAFLHSCKRHRFPLRFCNIQLAKVINESVYAQTRKLWQGVTLPAWSFFYCCYDSRWWNISRKTPKLRIIKRKLSTFYRIHTCNIFLPFPPVSLFFLFLLFLFVCFCFSSITKWTFHSVLPMT